MLALFVFMGWQSIKSKHNRWLARLAFVAMLYVISVGYVFEAYFDWDKPWVLNSVAVGFGIFLVLGLIQLALTLWADMNKVVSSSNKRGGDGG